MVVACGRSTCDGNECRGCECDGFEDIKTNHNNMLGLSMFGLCVLSVSYWVCWACVGCECV